MKNKNKYSTIFILYSMLSYGVYGIAGSSSSTADFQNTSKPIIFPTPIKQTIFDCYTPEMLYGFEITQTPVQNPEKIETCSFSKVEPIYDQENNNWKIMIDNSEILTLSIDNSYLCFHPEKDPMDMRLVRFIIDPIDSTKGIFMKLYSFTDESSEEETKQKQNDRANIYLLLLSVENGFIHMKSLIENELNPSDQDTIKNRFMKFCVKSMQKLKNYIENNPEEGMELIREYIDKPEFRSFFNYISNLQGIKLREILKDNPNLLNPDPNPDNPNGESNLREFFRNNPFYLNSSNLYRILSNRQIEFETKIHRLNRLLFPVRGRNMRYSQSVISGEQMGLEDGFIYNRID